MQKYATAFRGMPLVFMTQDEHGDSEFYGRRDLIDLVSEIPLTYITWKEYRFEDADDTEDTAE